MTQGILKPSIFRAQGDRNTLRGRVHSLSLRNQEATAWHSTRPIKGTLYTEGYLGARGIRRKLGLERDPCHQAGSHPVSMASAGCPHILMGAAVSPAWGPFKSPDLTASQFHLTHCPVSVN